MSSGCYGKSPFKFLCTIIVEGGLDESSQSSLKVLCRWSGCHRVLVEKAEKFSELRGEKQAPIAQERAVRAEGGLPAPLGAEGAVTRSSATSLCCWCCSDLVMPNSESPPPTAKFRKQKKIFSLTELLSSFLSLPCNFIFSHSQSSCKGLSFIVLLDFYINQWQINACNTILNTRQHWFWGEG